MRHPHIIVYETDGWLAAQVTDLARESGWMLRESRNATACLNLLREARPVVVLLKLERKLIDEVTLLAEIQEKVPDCPIVVFCDVKLEGAHQRMNLASLAFDLGARYVMFPPLTRNLIEDLVAGLMEASIHRGAIGAVHA